MEEMIKTSIIESIDVKKKILDQKYLKVLHELGERMVDCISKGGKIMLCGNGGSAADAQHLAAEFLVRLRPKINRNPLPAIALAQDTSTITACGNDFGFEKLFGFLYSNQSSSRVIISSSFARVIFVFFGKSKRPSSNFV